MFEPTEFHKAHALGKSLQPEVWTALAAAPPDSVGFIVEQDAFGRELVSHYAPLATLFGAQRIGGVLVFAIDYAAALELLATRDHQIVGNNILQAVRASLIDDPTGHSLVVTCAAGVVVAARCPRKKGSN